MTVVFMTNPANGDCALFDEAPGGGAFDDVNSLRNRPLNDPTNWLANLYFHSQLDNLEVAFDQTTSVTHASVPAASTGGDQVTMQSGVKFNAASSDNLLVQHNLGYIPDCLVARGNNALWPGFPVQVSSGGRGRYAVVYATTTQIRLYTWASASVSSSLSSTTLAYRTLVFRKPPAAAGNVVIDVEGGHVQMGRGRFDSERAYLQVVPGGTPFGLFTARPGDLANGAPRIYRPDGTSFDPVPSDMKGRLVTATSFGSAAMNYDGSYAAPASIAVQAP